MKRSLAVSIFLTLAIGAARAQPHPVPDSAAGPVIAASARNANPQVDALFAAWNHPDSPGATLAVVQDGRIVYQRGYGMADIERGAPNSPATVYHIASMSKQFTAFAIELLAQDGKLALDDDVRKYLPELHDFGHVITIRQLLHHTSGMRDQWNLLALAGWRLDDVITEEDVLRMLWQQRELNFEPGSEELYSNSGYTLLGQIVKRVSGQSLADFARVRIFEPLGMRHTHFQEDYRTLVPGRASSYVKQADGRYEYMALSYSSVGPSSLFTTVGDLALWDQNFYDARVGGQAVLAQMLVRGELNDGKILNYASGLMLGSYRGQGTVDHGGADAGFRTDLLRFPDQHFSVIVLANAGEANPGQLARKVADLYLAKVLTGQPAAQAPAAKPAPALAEIAAAPELLDSVAGDYALAPDFVITFTHEGGQLMAQATGQGKFPVFLAHDRTFFSKVVDAQFTFDAPGADGVVAAGTLHQNGRDMPARRVQPVQPDRAQLAARAGEFYSDELHVLYTLRQQDGKLLLRYPRGEVTLSAGPGGSYLAGFPFGKLQFECDAAGDCDSFTLNDGRVRKLRFVRVTVNAVSGHQAGPSIVLPPLASSTAP